MTNFNKYLSTLFIVLSFAMFLTSCTLVDHDDQSEEVNFGYETEAVANILNRTCAVSGCHSGSDEPLTGNIVH